MLGYTAHVFVLFTVPAGMYFHAHMGKPSFLLQDFLIISQVLLSVLSFTRRVFLSSELKLP